MIHAIDKEKKGKHKNNNIYVEGEELKKCWVKAKRYLTIRKERTVDDKNIDLIR